jgi:hypothetical protein
VGEHGIPDHRMSIGDATRSGAAMEANGSATPAAGGTAARRTVVGLFEDTIDAEQALLALRKANHAADIVSLVVRDKAAEENEGPDRAGAVARAIVATALGAVGGWLQGLAELIVPERGTYLVAGPIGAALAGISAARDQGRTAWSYAAASDLTADSLLRTLTDFGFGPEEANYLEHRLAAGSALVAVTTNDPDSLQSTRRIFADHDAVYIGLAETDPGLFAEAEALLAAPPEASSGGDVVVTDAVAPLRRVTVAGGPAEAAALCDRDVVDTRGGEAGIVEDVLVETIDPDGPLGPEPPRLVPRYVVVGFGGVLGLGRRRVAVPVELADLATDPLRLNVERDILHRAPAYDDDAPFSRREEQALYGYFGLRPYWLEA